MSLSLIIMRLIENNIYQLETEGTNSTDIAIHIHSV